MVSIFSGIDAEWSRLSLHELRIEIREDFVELQWISVIRTIYLGTDSFLFITI